MKKVIFKGGQGEGYVVDLDNGDAPIENELVKIRVEVGRQELIPGQMTKNRLDGVFARDLLYVGLRKQKGGQELVFCLGDSKGSLFYLSVSRFSTHHIMIRSTLTAGFEYTYRQGKWWKRSFTLKVNNQNQLKGAANA